MVAAKARIPDRRVSALGVSALRGGSSIVCGGVAGHSEPVRACSRQSLSPRKCLTSRQSQRRCLSRSVQSHRSRQPPSWLTCNVGQNLNGSSDMRSVRVKNRKEGERFVFSARVCEEALAILRQPNGRAWLIESVTLRSKQQGCEYQDLVVASVRTRCENRFAMLADHLDSEPNQSPEPTTTAVTICAEPQIAPAAVVAHL